MIPLAIEEPSLRYNHVTKLSNEEALRTNLDMEEEQSELALIWIATQKQRI